MVREVFPNIYLNEIPLPNNPLRALNSYIILSEEKYLIMDTGFNMNVCKEAFMKGVNALGVDLTRTDLVLTHMHVDHSGLADDLRRVGCRVLIGQKDGDFMNYFRTCRDSPLDKYLLQSSGRKTCRQKITAAARCSCRSRIWHQTHSRLREITGSSSLM